MHEAQGGAAVPQRPRRRSSAGSGRRSRPGWTRALSSRRSTTAAAAAADLTTPGPTRPERGLIAGMDDNDSDHYIQANVPVVVVPRPVMRASWAKQRLTRWRSGNLPDQLRRASRHPAVVASLATAAELILHAGLRWALAGQGRSAGAAGSAIPPTPVTVPDGGSLVLWRRTVVVESWMVRGR
jgi:hypothetical protein